MKGKAFERSDIGRIGVDAVGNRFVVLAPGSVQGEDYRDDPWYVAIIGRRSTTAAEARGGLRKSGTIVHASWLAGRRWLDEEMNVAPGDLREAIRLLRHAVGNDMSQPPSLVGWVREALALLDRRQPDDALPGFVGDMRAPDFTGAGET